MDVKKYEYVPIVNCSDDNKEEINDKENEVVGDSACPCCGYITIPNKGDALAYICPVCFWEIDLFIKSDNELSDLNHSLTLIQAKKNYKKFGAVTSYLKQYCREPIATEYPE